MVYFSSGVSDYRPRCECKLANWCRFVCVCVQHGDSTVRTYHLEYAEGGILDMDDLLTDLVEDRDKVRFKHNCLF